LSYRFRKEEFAMDYEVTLDARSGQAVRAVVRCLSATLLLTCWSAASAAAEPPAQAARALVLVHVAVYEVINFIDGAYPSRLLSTPPQSVNTSRQAAAVAAAHVILTTLYPEQEVALDEELRTILDGIPDGAGKHSGIVLGRALAMNVYALLGAARMQPIPDAHAARYGLSDESAARGIAR
jgi:hypothetical protein